MSTKPHSAMERILNKAFETSSKHMGFLITLSLGVAVIMTIGSLLLQPTANAFISAVIDPGNEAAFLKAIQIAKDNFLLFIVVQIIMVIGTALGLVPWVRRAEDFDALDQLPETEGGWSAFQHRALRSFFHLLGAVSMTAVVAMSLMVITSLLASLHDKLFMIGLVITLVGTFYAHFFFTSAAHMAVILESRDIKIQMTHSWKIMSANHKPVVSSLAVLFFLIVFGGSFISGFVTSLMPVEIGTTLGLILSNLATFLVSALHIAGLISYIEIEKTS